jgi:predicted dithiol-disulfide oxidoreductase (DUF899 family)
MTQHAIEPASTHTAARLELLEAEKELTRRGDELARQRQALPWVPIDKDCRFTSGSTGRRGGETRRRPDDPLNFFRRHDEYDPR